ncbi:MAG: histidine kinase [Bacteroidales bacterium]|nr:histidine kinase [Bacteroidales bacterium]
MKAQFIILIFLFAFETQAQSLVESDRFFLKADSLYSEKLYQEAFDAYKRIENKNKELDSIHLGRLYLGLNASSEKLQNYAEAITYHLLWRKFVPFPNQAENQYYLDRVSQILPCETDSLSLSRLYYRYAVLLSKEVIRDQAFDYFIRALNLAKGLKHYAAVATIANEIAGEYWDIGEKQLSTNFYKESLEAAIILKDSTRIAGSYVNLADNYIQGGDFKQGIQMHLKALKIKELSQDKERISYFYQTTAGAYYDARNYEKWQEYFNKAYALRNDEIATSPQEKATLYIGMGGIASYNRNLENAILYYDTLLVLSKEIAYNNGQKIALDNLALLHKDMGNYKKALDLFNQSEAFLTDNPFHLISHNNAKAELLQHLNKPKEALALVHQNIANKALENYASEKLRTFRLLYELNTKLANYSAAFRWNDSLRSLENKLRDADVRKEIAEIETRYQTEKKEQQISLLTAENEIKNQRMQQALLFIGFLLVLVSLILFLLYFRRKQATFKQSELQQQLLRSQMNPHFIFNVMGSIQSYLYKNEADKAADYLSRFAALSRSVLNFSTQEKIALKDEIEMLQNYIELERARLENPFEVTFNIPDDLESEFIEISPMLLQPFVENAIKHGLQNIDYQGQLYLSFKEINRFIEVEIIDNGKGLGAENKGDHESKALAIFKQRKKVIEHKFKKELTFEFQDLKTIDETKQGLRVYLQLPILNND